MPKVKARDELTQPTSTIIGQGFTIQTARLSGSESMRVDGTVIGEVILENGALHVSETGLIQGDITTSSARLAGRVLGDVVCRARLHLTSTAIISGDITSDLLIVDEGAVFHGRCTTHNQNPPE